MKLVSKSTLIKGVAKQWRAQYPEGDQRKDTIYHQLCNLSENATEDDIARIIGNSSWTSIRCDECKQETDAIVVLGDEPNYDSATAMICFQCLAKAISLTAKVAMK